MNSNGNSAHRVSVLGERRSVSPETTVEDATTCTADTDDGGSCGQPAMVGAPFGICTAHALALYRHVAELVSEPLACLREMQAVRRHWDMMNGWPDVVYYIALGSHIKIGTTGEMFFRLAAYPPMARVLALEPGDRKLERARHAEFADLRTGGEWFTPGPKLIEHIRRVAAAGLPKAPAVPA